MNASSTTSDLGIVARASVLALVSVAFAGDLAAQQLRRAVESVAVVVAARHEGVRPLGKEVLLHRLRVLDTLKAPPGQALPEIVTVVELKGVALHARPAPAETRLYCLIPYPAPETLPQAFGPYFKMSGHPGANPAIGDDRDTDPAVAFARLVLDAERGADPAPLAEQVLRLGLLGPAWLRSEAIELLAERPVLQQRLGPVQLSELLGRAVAETEDIPYKIALATLCAERRMPNVIDSLCLSLRETKDLDFARALGRLARALHGEAAVDVLRPHIVRTRDADVRGRLLVALGATATESARQALVRMRDTGGPDRWVDAALAEQHR